MKYTLYVLAICVALCACSGSNNNNTNTELNIYTDATLMKITDMRCTGNYIELTNFCKDRNPSYRNAAVLALGSTKNKSAMLTIASMLQDPDSTVRASALFALGELETPEAEPFLLKYDLNNQCDDVKAATIVALSRCGGEKSLKYVENMRIPHSNVILVTAQSKALCLFAKRNLYSINSTQKAISYICDTTIHEKARSVAAEYFGICNTDFSLYTDEFVKAFKSAKLISFKNNLMLALGKCHNGRAFSLLKTILESNDEDYRVISNAIVAFENYSYQNCKATILRLLDSKDDKVSSRAANFLKHKGDPADTLLYLDLFRNASRWQTRTTLLATALKFSNNKAPITTSIQSGVEVAQNIYEKAALINALEYDFASYSYLKDFPYSDNDYIRTMALKTLIDMYDAPQFAQYAKSMTDKNVVKEFAIIFKHAVQHGTPQMAAMAAMAIARHKEIIWEYTNTFFINNALSQCVLPQDADAYILLAEAGKIITGKDVDINFENLFIQPDWNYIKSIKPGQLVEVSTNKGKITIETNVNNAPIAVSNFLKLVEEQYFNHTCFASNGLSNVCNRGSISGFDDNKAQKIPSELSEIVMDEGTVSLVTSALNNSYTTQWTILLTPDVLLDGTTSVVGRVVKGMNVVHSLNTGDEIVSMKMVGFL